MFGYVKKFLDNEFDIHGGGRDLIFPHHENEIAQSRCAIKQNLLQDIGYIMDLYYVQWKMAKSQGNILK